MTNLALAFRLARREMRGGVRGFRIFVVCLALGVAAIAAVGSVRTAIQTGLTQEAASLLGGDAELRFTYRYASDAERAWMADNATAVSEVVDFRSMLVVNRDDDRERALAQVKGIDDLYPLYGSVALEPDMPLDDALAWQDGGLPGLIAEPVLIDRMGLVPGDTVTLGTQDFELRAALMREPDSAAAGFALGPRVIVAAEALADSGLLTEGTLFESRYRVRVGADANLGALRRDATQQFRDAGLRWRDSRNGTPSIARFVERMGSFLVIVGLAGLAVGGVGVSAAVRAFLDRKIETIATLKTLGATGGTIFAVYLIQIGILALIGVAIGLLIGGGLPAALGPLFADQLPVPALFSFYPAPLFEAALYGMLTALIFTLWPLARAREIRAAALFRDAISSGLQLPGPMYLVVLAMLIAALVMSAAWLSGIPVLALWAAAGIVASLAVLVLAAMALRWLAGRVARTRLTRGRPALRMALGAVAGPGGETASVVLSLGLGLTVLAAIGQIDSNLRNTIARDLPDIAPAYFFVDIQNDQLEGFRSAGRAQEGVNDIDTAPMLRGILTRINDRPAREVSGPHWVLRGDRGVTYAETPPEGAAIVDGDWWPADYSGPPLVSFAEEEALEMGLKLGDKITINVLGRDITAEIANLRVVEFRNMGINFLMILNPGALAGAPHTHIATVYADDAAEAPLLRSLADAYPNITAIRVKDGIARVTEALGDLATATRYGAAVTLLTGFIVLIGAAAAGERRRVFEAAVLKTLGAERARILASFAIRSALLGGAAGMVAIVAGALGGWGVMTFVMDSDYVFEPISALTIVVGGAVASLLAGLAFAWGPLSVRPAQVLRARD